MSRRFRMVWRVLFLVVLFPAGILAQGFQLYQKNGATAGDLLGVSVASAGDVNGDGKADFIIGAYQADPGGIAFAGSAYVYSGATGALLFQKNGAAAGDQLGRTVAGAGDVNGDGKADFIIGASDADPGGFDQAGSAYVYSGATGTLLYQKDGAAVGEQLGFYVASAGDVDGDGKADFMVGAPYASPGGLISAGSAYLYSGATGALLYQKDGAAGFDNLGFSVAGAGDVNGDGKGDFIIGAPGTSPGELAQAGSAYLYSGATGALLYQKDGTADNDALGFSVAGAGDVNGDTKADFIIGAPDASPGGLVMAGSAYLYSGATGALLFQKNGAVDEDRLGYSVAGAGDVNGDGRVDFIIGVPNANPGGIIFAGSTYLYSGATGVLLLQKNGAAAFYFQGNSVAGAGDVNGDGRSDFIIGVPGADPGGLANAGSAFVYSFASLCPAAKGDMNGDGILTGPDVILLLNCAFLGTGNCEPCFADANCDGVLTGPDVILELNAAFLGMPITCSP